MKTICILAKLSFVIFVLQSCSPTYVANTTNVPLLSGKGEFKASVCTGTSDIEPQLSYALTDHIGLMANGCFSFHDGISDNTTYAPKRNFFEGGIGYLNSPEQHQIIELFGGYGKGYVGNNYNITQSSDYFSADYQRFFIQPSIGLRGKYMEGGFAFRFSYLTIDKTMVDKNLSIQNFYFEPTFTFRGGFENLKATVQVGFSKRLGGYDTNFDHRPFIFGLGLQFSMGGKKEAKIE